MDIIFVLLAGVFTAFNDVSIWELFNPPKERIGTMGLLYVVLFLDFLMGMVWLPSLESKRSNGWSWPTQLVADFKGGDNIYQWCAVPFMLLACGYLLTNTWLGILMWALIYLGIKVMKAVLVWRWGRST